MSLQLSVRGVIWLLSISILLSVSEVMGDSIGSSQVFYVCDSKSVQNCPAYNSFRSLSEAVQKAGENPTRIVLLQDTGGTTIPAKRKILGIYANRQVINSTITFEEGYRGKTEIVGITFRPFSRISDIIEIKEGGEYDLIDNCFIGGNRAVSARNGSIVLTGNFFMDNKYGLELNAVEDVDSSGDTFFNVKKGAIYLSFNSSGYFSDTIVHASAASKELQHAAIEIYEGSNARFNNINISGLKSLNLFYLHGDDVNVQIDGGQIYKNGDRQNSTTLFSIEDDSGELTIGNSVIKGNIGYLINVYGGKPSAIDFDDSYVEINNGGITKYGIFFDGKFKLNKSLFKINGKKRHVEKIFAGGLSIDKSNIVGLNRLALSAENVQIDSSIITLKGSSLRVASDNTSISNSNITLANGGSLDLDDTAGGKVNIDTVTLKTPIMRAKNVGELSIKNSSFYNSLSLYLGKSNRISNNRFHIDSNKLTFTGNSGTTTTADNNIFVPVVSFDGKIQGADFRRNYWGTDELLYNMQLATCNYKGVDCSERLRSKPFVPVPWNNSLPDRDIADVNKQKECVQLKDSTKDLINIYLDDFGDLLFIEDDDEKGSDEVRRQ